MLLPGRACGMRSGPRAPSPNTAQRSINFSPVVPKNRSLSFWPRTQEASLDWRSCRFVRRLKGAALTGWLSSRGGYVVPEARRRGVGRGLVAAAEQWGRDQGCTEFASDTQPDNLVSATAHLALGFTDAGSLRCFRKDL